MKRKLFLVTVLLLALVISGGVFAYAAMTNSMTITATEKAELAPVTTGSITWNPVGGATANITPSTAFTVTPATGITAFPDLYVHVYLLNAPALRANYDYINMKVNVADNVTSSGETILSLTNGEVIFKATGLTAATPFNVKVTGGSYYCYDESGAVAPELWCEVKQAATLESTSP